MRITGGIYGGRVLEAPKDRTIRPTSDKVRQAVFNVFNARGLVDGANVLDAFCGTGALGIEALSWGASCCSFMDKNRTSLELCRRNFAALKIDAQHNFLLKDAVKPGIKPAEMPAANLVFLDPPYKQELVQQSLGVLISAGWLARGAHALIEAEKAWNPAALAEFGHEVLLTRYYGDTQVVLLACSIPAR